MSLVAVTAACGDAGDSGSSPYAPLYRGLCNTRSRADEPAAARDVFFDQAHQRLHDLAADVAEHDRAAAARLLESKEAVERDLTSDAASLPSDLDRLLAAARAAIAAAGVSAPDDCKDVP